MNSKENVLSLPLNKIKGIGEERFKLFSKLRIYTIGDLLEFFPREYEDRGSYKTSHDFINGEECSFKAMVVMPIIEKRVRKNITLISTRASDGTGFINLVWFNQPYIKNNIHTGETYSFYGKIQRKGGMWEVSNPVFETVDKKKNTGKIFPVYPSTQGLSQTYIRQAAANAILLARNSFIDCIPNSLRVANKLCEINYAMEKIHFPNDENEIEEARKRLVYEELFLFILGITAVKRKLIESTEFITFDKEIDMAEIYGILPFNLTNAQQKVLNEIYFDMESKKNMNRLVQGDVGSGKTIVAALAIFKAVKNGYQGAYMAPTEILIRQHFESLEPLLAPFGIKIEILVGSITKKKKLETIERLQNGEINVLFGTHALLEENVVFNNLGLVVTDEQHRFGVRQRSLLSSKGKTPDVLVMTATPIPRTLALILYGDLDISIIDELPPGRKPIKTYAVNNSMRERIDNFIRRLVNEGRQIYIVCPLVEDSEEIEATSAEEQLERIRNVLPDLRSELLHGKLKDKEKHEIMATFKNGDIDVLISTTVIEVGVNVPNATLMIVENAERFGLAQLHQLRGRVGRGHEQSFCILFNESKSDVSKKRMKVMEDSNDGFVIAEKDLELRGPGEFFGTRQHGIPELKIANLYKDMEVLLKVQKDVSNLLKEDPSLEDAENWLLKEAVHRRFDSRIEL